MEVPSTKPYFSEECIQEILKETHTVLQTGRLILGPYTRDFEKRFREYCGVKHAVAVSSCTAALEITLRYFGVKDREVIIPTNTFIATGNAVLYAGGNLVLSDIKPDTLCLDPEDMKKRIGPKTRGVIVVHLAGLLCPEIEEIRKLCQEKGLFLIEDAAHAHGATINGRKSGSCSDAGCFSFYPTKVMTTTVGGMITTNDDALAEYAISLRHHGVGKSLENIVNLGNNWLMSEIEAILGIQQMKVLDENLAYRNRVAERYNKLLADVNGVKVFKVPSNIRHSYYKYPLHLSKTVNKEKLIAKMKSRYNVALGSSYDPPCHLQPAYQKYLGYRPGMFPVAEKTLNSTVALPIFVPMSDAEIDYVVQSLKETIPLIKSGMN